MLHDGIITYVDTLYVTKFSDNVATYLPVALYLLRFQNKNKDSLLLCVICTYVDVIILPAVGTNFVFHTTLPQYWCCEVPRCLVPQKSVSRTRRRSVAPNTGCGGFRTSSVVARACVPISVSDEQQGGCHRDDNVKDQNHRSASCNAGLSN